MNNYIVLLAYSSTIFKNIFISLKDEIFWIIPGPKENSDGSNPIKEHRFKQFYCIVSFVILFLLISQRSIKNLAKFSYFSISVFVLIIGVCIFQTGSYYNPEFKLNWINTTPFSFLESFGSIVFAFNCIYSFYGVSIYCLLPSVLIKDAFNGRVSTQ